MSKIHKADVKVREAAGQAQSPTPAISEAEGLTKEDRPTHIAFGSKVVIPLHARKSSRDSGSAGGRSSREGSGRPVGLNHSNSVPHLRSNSPNADLDTSKESGRQSHRLAYQRSVSDAMGTDSPKPQLGVEATQTAIQPRPPRTGSGSKTRRRPVRARDSNSAKARGSVSNRKTSEVDKSGVGKDESDSCPDSISRSQSESSLQMSGGEAALSESFGQLALQSKKDKSNCKPIEETVDIAKEGSSSQAAQPRNTEDYREMSGKGVSGGKGKDGEQNSNGHAEVVGSQGQHAPTPKASQESMFTFSSRPRSAPRSPRARWKTKSQNPEKAQNGRPEIQITTESTESDSGSTGKSRGRKESDRSEYEEDFHRASAESSEDDDLQKFLKSGSHSRSSSRGSRRSPLASTSSSGEAQPVTPSPQCLRTSIKSSLLKEVCIVMVLSYEYYNLSLCTMSEAQTKQYCKKSGVSVTTVNNWPA